MTLYIERNCWRKSVFDVFQVCERGRRFSNYYEMGRNVRLYKEQTTGQDS